MIPLGARFLTLMSHLVGLGMVTGARDTHVRTSLPVEFSAEGYARVNTELLCALGLAAVLLAIEFGGFFMGVSMFHRGQGLFSVGAHAAASITLGLALMDGWDLGGFWLLLGLCSAPPAITELLLLPAALGRGGSCPHKGPSGRGGRLGPRPPHRDHAPDSVSSPLSHAFMQMKQRCTLGERRGGGFSPF